MSEQPRDARAAGADEPAARPGLLERLRGLFGLGGASIRDDIQEALEESAATTDLSSQERTMLQNVLGLRELRVDDIMVPRADIIAVNIDATLAELLSLFRTAGHSRLPVHGDTLDDPRGMVHIRDFLDHLSATAERIGARRRRPENAARSEPPPRPRGFGGLDLSRRLSGAKIIRPVLFVPPSMPALDLLLKMQTTHTHMALVIDEYGGTDGLASIEDIVEMIVGDIEDEHDESDAPMVVASADGSLMVDARASLEDLSTALELPEEAFSELEEEVDTLGGLITTLAGRVPVRGEIIAGPHDLEFEVLDADPRRLKRLRVRRGVDATARARTADTVASGGGATAEPAETLPVADMPPESR